MERSFRSLLLGLGLLVAAGCRRAQPGALQRVEIADPKAHWADGGFSEMIPPIRLPTSPDGMDHITVWLRIPEGRRIGARPVQGQDGFTLTYPSGTVADRVELNELATATEGQHGWNVMDVRGTWLGEAGVERFHCLQPSAPEQSGLTGFEWPRGDDQSENAATDGLVEIVRRGRLADVPEDEREPSLARLRQVNHCQPCHVHDHAARISLRDRGARRATDSAGFYVILSVLGDSAPLEVHRPRELNADDPFVTVSCGDAPASLVRGGRADPFFSCPDDRVPVARLDLSRALAAGQAHALAVCRSRRYLFDHMDEAGHAAFARAFAECAIHR